MAESTGGAAGEADDEPAGPYGRDVGGCSSTLRDDGVFVFVAEAGTSAERVAQWFDLVPVPPGFVLDGRVELRFAGPPVPGFDGPPGLGRGLCGTDVRS